LRLALCKGPNRVGVSPHLRTETDPVSETLCSLVFQNTGRCTNSQKRNNSKAKITKVHVYVTVKARRLVRWKESEKCL
jgi:hypothetical protein